MSDSGRQIGDNFTSSESNTYHHTVAGNTFLTEYTFSQYQNDAKKTAVYPIKEALYYLSLGLTGEAGEVANKVKKIIRDDNGILSLNTKSEIRNELGDILWYIANLCDLLEIEMGLVAQINIYKLHKRLKNNTIHGHGDDR